MKSLTLIFLDEPGNELKRFKAEFNENNPVAEKIWEMLPIKYRLVYWGDSMSIDLPPLNVPKCEETMNVKEGDIVYWNPASQIQIFYGKTPASKDNAPGVISPVVPIGSLKDDPKSFKEFIEVVPRRTSYITFAQD